MEGLQFESSGSGAMQENERALAEVAQKMEALTERSRQGEDVLMEVRKLSDLKQRLVEDKSRILAAGM